MIETRIDKWLWATRIFKSRTQANTATKKGHILLNGDKAKPSSTVKEGDELLVKKNGYNYEFRVEKIIDKRVSATIAVNCYKNITPEDELRKFDTNYIGKGKIETREKGLGRPTKKDRRSLDEFKGWDEF
ncbi:RNA-binding S4 domain-containing protein [Membranihabitans marinus]|uniref:RNA-binding S4 domain-containing protein n=1 Tax=Membranihabitans marinus TaxID=1227546 RepID=UPI001F401E36|nr:RNA-binding S4 domain-containing protein [Membranihabitans marinus]